MRQLRIWTSSPARVEPYGCDTLYKIDLSDECVVRCRLGKDDDFKILNLDQLVETQETLENKLWKIFEESREPLSRTQIAWRLGVSHKKADSIVGKLLKSGYVEQCYSMTYDKKDS